MSWVGQDYLSNQEKNQGKNIYLRNIQILPLFSSGFIKVLISQIRKFNLFTTLNTENSKPIPNILKYYPQWERL